MEWSVLFLRRVAASTLKSLLSPRLLFGLDQTRIMHPDDIPSEYPSKCEEINCAEDYASDVAPYKARQELEQRVVKFYRLAGEKQTVDKTRDIEHFSP
mgnify:FL=1